MTKEIILTISGLHETDGDVDAPIETMTPGQYYMKNGKHYVVYDEVLEGLEGTVKSTIKFTVPGDEKENMQTILRSVFDALNEKGYNPINQLVGYLLTEDPTYITNYNNARSKICKIDRDELMQELVRCYLFANS